ncbi:S-adenosylmethionine synthetase [Candidatus Malacoplasma girerdii]|uniref:Methionine adenosyltransferase n=1 Tax=Candidatus Malacoplasma girerdii TaxID=1318617 RepID=A0A097SSG6_9BACT|nr:S-adenosylmethionine synthetase [Candidatus Malacoplasma girerdii]
MNVKPLSIITSESVGIGHPDKICDQIADNVLTKCLSVDPNSRVACEVFACNRLIVIGGEITTKAYVDVIRCAWEVLLPLGYKENDFDIMNNINHQSSEISAMVNKKNKLGAGDIGVMYGYATNETPEYLPLPYIFATKALFHINNLTFKKKLKGAKFDSKCQVSAYYDEAMKPVGIDNVIISLQHEKNADLKKLSNEIKEKVLLPLAVEYKVNKDFDVYLNQNGTFIVGGPIGDTGLTGRKLMVDTYGTIGRHGGGAFSGKDYTKVDRTGAYLARYIAKNLVAARVADRIEIQLAYNIGSEKPVSMYVDTFNTHKIKKENIYKIINELIDFSLTNIVSMFQLKSFNYSKCSVYGHFNNLTINKPWEELNLVDKIKVLMKKR